MKYAELPDGRMLQFADNVSDKQMQRAVQDAMGLTAPRDVFKDMDKLSSKLDEVASRKPEAPIKLEPLLDGLKTLNKAVKDLSGHLILQNAQHSKAIDHLVKSINNSNDDIANSTGKALSTLTQATARLGASITAFNEHVKEAVEHSTEAIQADLKASMRSITAVEAGIKELTALTQQFTQAMNLSTNARLLRKRAFRNADGSWTMEVIDLPRVRH